MRLISLLSFIFLVSCSNRGLETRKQIRDLFVQAQYDKAQEVLQKSEMAKDANTKILYLFESGSLYFAAGNFLAATTQWELAKKQIEDYIISVSKEAGTFLFNENIAQYKGETYEISLMYFYLSSAYFNIYQQGYVMDANPDVKAKDKWIRRELTDQQRRTYLFAARASVLAWDTFFQTLQRSNRKTLYQSDLLVKLMGALIHEAIGGADLQIALQLYQDALVVFYSIGPIYPSFNKKFLDYLKKTNVEDLRRTSAPDKHFEATDYFYQTELYLKSRIYWITKNHRASSLKEVSQRFKIDGKNILPESLSTQLVASSGLIQEKKGRLINLGLRGLTSNIQDPATRAAVHAVGEVVLMMFAMNTLKLVPNSGYMSYGEFMFAHDMSRVAANEVAVEFEVPMVELPKNVIAPKFKNNNSFYLVAPVSELARIAIEESAALRITRTGVRVGIKYLIAIIAAYKTYQMSKDNPFGPTLVMAQFILSSKGILQTERADTRHWTLLPSDIYFAPIEKAEQNVLIKLPQAERKLSVPAKQNFFTHHLI